MSENENNLAVAKVFAGFMKEARRMFPQFAKEIDRCLFDVVQNNLGSCGHAYCDCQMTFEQFHDAQNRAARNGKIQL